MIYQDNTSQVQCSLFLSLAFWKILFNSLVWVTFICNMLNCVTNTLFKASGFLWVTHLKKLTLSFQKAIYCKEIFCHR